MSAAGLDAAGKEIGPAMLPETVPCTPTRTRLDDGVVLFTGSGAALRASDGGILAEGLPVAAGETVYYCSSGKPSSVAAHRLPSEAGDALKLDRIWNR